jgi:putative peptide zinc metalloprotease protein
VRAEVDGFVRALKVRDGQAVAAGDLLLSLDNPDLQTERDTLASRLEGQQSDRFQLLLRDPAAAQNLAEDVARTEAELARAEQRLAQLTVRAGEAGVLSLPHFADMQGQYVRRGEVVGYVLPNSGSSVQLRAAVDQDHAYLVRSHTHGVSVRLAGDAGVGPALPAAMSGNVPAATRMLPSMALGDRAGGPYAVDPADSDGLRAIDPVMLVDVLVAPPAALEAGQRVGGRAWVRFDHGVEPLAFQFYRRATQLFLKQFDPDA